jgi:hypothetical protein
VNKPPKSADLRDVLLEFGVDAGKHTGVVQNQLAHKATLNKMDGVQKER